MMGTKPQTVPLSSPFSYRGLAWMDGAACRHSGMHTPEHRLWAMCEVCTLAEVPA